MARYLELLAEPRLPPPPPSPGPELAPAPPPLWDSRASMPPCSALVAPLPAPTATTGTHHWATPPITSEHQTAPPTHSAWTSPQTATGDVMPTPGRSSPAPPGTPASLATHSLLGHAGPPSSAHSASSFLLSRRAPAAPPAAPTWLGSGRPADGTTARVLLQM